MKDFTIIGSGAGGSSAALELLENGYSVEVFEEGYEYDLNDKTMMQGLISFGETMELIFFTVDQF